LELTEYASAVLSRTDSAGAAPALVIHSPGFRQDVSENLSGATTSQLEASCQGEEPAGACTAFRTRTALVFQTILMAHSDGLLGTLFRLAGLIADASGAAEMRERRLRTNKPSLPDDEPNVAAEKRPRNLFTARAKTM
jgi:hypothetical protein